MTSVPMTLRDLQDHFSCFKLFWLLSSKKYSTYYRWRFYIRIEKHIRRFTIILTYINIKGLLKVTESHEHCKNGIMPLSRKQYKHAGLRCYNTDHYTSMVYMAYRIAPFLETFSDLWCHSSPVLRACYAQLEKISALPRTSSVTWTLNDSVTSHLQGTCMYNETNGSLLKRRTPFLWKWKL